MSTIISDGVYKPQTASSKFISVYTSQGDKKIELISTAVDSWLEEEKEEVQIEVIGTFKEDLGIVNPSAISKWASIRWKCGKWNQLNWVYPETMRRGFRDKQCLIVQGNSIYYYHVIPNIHDALKAEYDAAKLRFDITRKNKTPSEVQSLQDHLTWTPILRWEGDKITSRQYDIEVNLEDKILTNKKTGAFIEGAEPQHLYYLIRDSLPTI